MMPISKREDMTRADAGSAVLLAMVVMACMLAAGAGLLSLSATDRAMSANFRDGARIASAADAMASYAVGALGLSGAWAAALQPAGQAAFTESSLLVGTSWGSVLSLPAETADLQQRTNDRWTNGPDTPVWHLFAWGPLHALIPVERAAGSPYVLAWVADNPRDGDGDPAADRDGVLVLRAQARLGALTNTVELFIARGSSDTSVTSESAPPGDGSAGTGSGSMARILPETGGATSGTTGGGVRVISWRDVP